MFLAPSQKQRLNLSSSLAQARGLQQSKAMPAGVRYLTSQATTHDNASDVQLEGLQSDNSKTCPAHCDPQVTGSRLKRIRSCKARLFSKTRDGVPIRSNNSYNTYSCTALLHHLSISPNTTSSVPMTVTTSASIRRLHRKSVICRWAKPGERILHLQGHDTYNTHDTRQHPVPEDHIKTCRRDCTHLPLSTAINISKLVVWKLQ